MTFHKIDGDSINSITNALDIFHIPPTNVSVSSAKTFEILTSNPLTDKPYHFKLHSSDNYIDLSKCYLLTEFRIRKTDTQGDYVDLADKEDIAPIQLLGQTFIKNMKISINGREIFNSNSLMAYKSYLTHELSYSPAAKQAHLNAAGYYYDRDRGVTLESGTGHDERKALFAKSNTVQFMAKLDADLFNQPLYLINHCEMDVEITPNDPSFLLVAPNATAGTTYYLETLVNYFAKNLPNKNMIFIGNEIIYQES
jgi:hypothetical protein